MTKHVLLENARRSKYQEHPTLPVEAVYDAVNGLWQLLAGGAAVAFPRQATKKNDVETGEDMKGE